MHQLIWVQFLFLSQFFYWISSQHLFPVTITLQRALCRDVLFYPLWEEPGQIRSHVLKERICECWVSTLIFRGSTTCRWLHSSFIWVWGELRGGSNACPAVSPRWPPSQPSDVLWTATLQDYQLSVVRFSPFAPLRKPYQHISCLSNCIDRCCVGSKV